MNGLACLAHFRISRPKISALILASSRLLEVPSSCSFSSRIQGAATLAAKTFMNSRILPRVLVVVASRSSRETSRSPVALLKFSSAAANRFPSSCPSVATATKALTLPTTLASGSPSSLDFLVIREKTSPRVRPSWNRFSMLRPSSPMTNSRSLEGFWRPTRADRKDTAASSLFDATLVMSPKAVAS